MQHTVPTPLSNVQLELLKAFSHQLTGLDLMELKTLDLKTRIPVFFAKRLVDQANQTWEEKGWQDQDIDRMLNTKMRKRE